MEQKPQEPEAVDYFTMAKDKAATWQEPLIHLHAAMSYIRSELSKIELDAQTRLEVTKVLDTLAAELSEFRRLEGVLFEAAAQANRIASGDHLAAPLEQMKSTFRQGLIQFDESVKRAEKVESLTMLRMLLTSLGSDIFIAWGQINDRLKGFLEELS